MKFFVYFCSNLTTEQYKITTMRTQNKEIVTDPVSEARRYVANAHTILIEKAGLDPETQFYRNRKTCAPPALAGFLCEKISTFRLQIE